MKLWALLCHNKFSNRTWLLGIFSGTKVATKAAKLHNLGLDNPSAVSYTIEKHEIDIEYFNCEDSHVVDL